MNKITAEQAAELVKRLIRKDAFNGTDYIRLAPDHIAVIVNAALSQNAAQGAGEMIAVPPNALWRNYGAGSEEWWKYGKWEARKSGGEWRLTYAGKEMYRHEYLQECQRYASQPHPIADPQICPKCIGSGESGISKETLRGDGEPCKACNGRGEIGGFISAESGYQTDPCPECAAPEQTMGEPVAYLIDGRVEQGLSFDRAAAETMAAANCGTVVPLSRSALAAAVKQRAKEICDELSKLYPREDVGFDKGYSMAAERARDAIDAIPTNQSALDAIVKPLEERIAELTDALRFADDHLTDFLKHRDVQKLLFSVGRILNNTRTALAQSPQHQPQQVAVDFWAYEEEGGADTPDEFARDSLFLEVGDVFQLQPWSQVGDWQTFRIAVNAAGERYAEPVTTVSHEGQQALLMEAAASRYADTGEDDGVPV
jgi:hypothetical protein